MNLSVENALLNRPPSVVVQTPAPYQLTSPWIKIKVGPDFPIWTTYQVRSVSRSGGGSTVPKTLYSGAWRTCRVS